MNKATRFDENMPINYAAREYYLKMLEPIDLDDIDDMINIIKASTHIIELMSKLLIDARNKQGDHVQR